MVFLLSLLLTSLALAQDLTGYWLSYKSSSNDPSSIIYIQKAEDGTFYGTAVAGFHYDGTHSDAICSQCSDKTSLGEYGLKKNEPVLGKIIMWSFVPNYGRWVDGKLLRVKNGTIYGCDLSLESEGRILAVKVKTGFFSKTVKWTKVSDNAYKQYCAGKSIDMRGKTFTATCRDK